MSLETDYEDIDGMKNVEDKIVVRMTRKSIFDPEPEVPGYRCFWINKNAKTGVTHYVFMPEEDK